MTFDELAEYYATLLDGELLRLAVQTTELEPEAQLALLQEIRRRGLEADTSLSVAPQSLPAVPPEYQEAGIDPDELVVIRKFPTLPEAIISKSILESAGIQCFLGDEHMIRINWLYSHVLGGLKLAVRQEDADAALDILEQSIEDPPCPK